MSQEQEFERDRALVARWRRAVDRSRLEAADELSQSLDPGDLALWREGRLDEAAADSIEAALSGDPGFLDHLLKTSTTGQPVAVSADLVTRLQALVPPSDSRVIPFRPKPSKTQPHTTIAIRWGALAASFLFVSVLGFSLGLSFDRSIASMSGSSPTLDLIDADTSDRG